MPRVKGGSASDKKRKKLFDITKGFWGRKKNTYRRAKEASLHALSSAYKDRRARKRDFRKLWVTRISAAARMNDISYSNFINGLKKADIQVNRKMLADLAVNDMQAFKALVEKAKEALGQ
ncbi:LSU ribosomal protein L20P [Thermovirga lienii DSM 17291]|jgi:large subunit ribosomal protein L20|uniref:Large ribosomal subunit protein bL20 n=1 Tax=Thermovirga lienii (strain ATCC BAA-1197 / DSM 17291 / Cas60314) TaxID=580340 RepID=G7V994_THELD|nr:50S ribosomal protein L20 [Thermovirga lienii]MDN5318434.1 large subunit ribosomal protein [Thermovirga sp.]AER66463.1 LSU ribosomal protein L20P [Thermovirga lienii DSM 17291]KUK42643.1 MAG: 50S ribosomal protein L20 [Thermovirga lienii]MDN5368113.1 large subunit ribosomal protein [Thermovirga sp.]HCD71579.1 50S ribosomal protein L20 [Thermovirga lienii]